ncbi:tumor necrosis factor alpha-induced protein 8-like protein isoform X2 [Neocloeon triangulifer]|nr:tumor necrosis factor alpha-induced protein 8-like protein isoform X2 [Neocloeon triangulifer]
MAGEGGFKARDIGLRAQKKILSRMANKSVAKVFIDDTTGSLLDDVYKLAKSYTSDKKESEKLVKNIIKIVIKLGLLYRNEQLSADELARADKFKHKFHSTAMAVVSFFEVDFSYDRAFLVAAFDECHQGLRSVVTPHLTPKSVARLDSVFNFFKDAKFLDAVFRKESPHRDALGRVVRDLNKALDEGGM